jgi:hypothetical protein
MLRRRRSFSEEDSPLPFAMCPETVNFQLVKIFRQSRTVQDDGKASGEIAASM